MKTMGDGKAGKIGGKRTLLTGFFGGFWCVLFLSLCCAVLWSACIFFLALSPFFFRLTFCRCHLCPAWSGLLQSTVGGETRAPAMLFASFDELFEFVEGALTRLLGPFFVGAVITLVSMFVSFVWACDVPFLWNAGHGGAALFVAALALVFGYSVLYFYFMSSVVDPGRAPTVAEYAALCASRGLQSPGPQGAVTREDCESSPAVSAPAAAGATTATKTPDDVEQVTFCTVDESVLEPGRPHRLVECVVCSKCESQRGQCTRFCVFSRCFAKQAGPSRCRGRTTARRASAAR